MALVLKKTCQLIKMVTKTLKTAAIESLRSEATNSILPMGTGISELHCNGWRQPRPPLGARWHEHMECARHI